MALPRADAGLPKRFQEAGRGAHQGHVRGVGEIEQRLVAGVHGRSVPEQNRRLRRQRRNQPVPHHPAEGGEVEDAVAGLDVAVELVLLDVLQQHAARAMDDAFGHSRGARGEEDEEGVIEGKPCEIDLAGREGADERVEGDRAGDGGRLAATQVRHHYRPLHRRKPLEDGRHAAERIVALPAIAVPVRDQEEAGADLAEAVDHAPHPEVG